MFCVQEGCGMDQSSTGAHSSTYPDYSKEILYILVQTASLETASDREREEVVLPRTMLAKITNLNIYGPCHSMDFSMPSAHTQTSCTEYLFPPNGNTLQNTLLPKVPPALLLKSQCCWRKGAVCIEAPTSCAPTPAHLLIHTISTEQVAQVKASKPDS